MLDNLVQGYRYVYVDTESVYSEQDFYKKLLKEILKLEGMETLTVRFLKAAGGMARKIKGIKIAGQGIDFNDGEHEVSYYDDLTHLLAGIPMEKDRKLILLIDEFPQTIQNIVRSKGAEAAIQFLQSNRTLRLSPDIVSRVRFIYTGSIGLNHTVSTIDSTAFINDLSTLEIGPLSRADAGFLLVELLKEKGGSIAPAASDHLLEKLEWLIPFHIQLLVQELLSLEGATTINIADVDLAFGNAIAVRNDNHFAHYYSRLKTQFKGADLGYALEVLNTIAESGTVHFIELLDVSVKFNIEFRKIIDVLVYDGYINNIGDKRIYRFNSPLVRMWWQKFICK
ncbi:hypothetical protein [Dinghuibacter silviterrae]|nr:hypothetical protein [Dinghuibacter silviterrae]